MPISSLNLKLICVPIMGCVPVLDISSENSNAPHKLLVSDKPTDLIFFFFTEIF